MFDYRGTDEKFEEPTAIERAWALARLNVGTIHAVSTSSVTRSRGFYIGAARR